MYSRQVEPSSRARSTTVLHSGDAASADLVPPCRCLHPVVSAPPSRADPPVGSDGRDGSGDLSPPPPAWVPSSLRSPLTRICRRRLDPVVSPPPLARIRRRLRREGWIRRPHPLPHGSCRLFTPARADPPAATTGEADLTASPTVMTAMGGPWTSATQLPRLRWRSCRQQHHVRVPTQAALHPEVHSSFSPSGTTPPDLP